MRRPSSRALGLGAAALAVVGAVAGSAAAPARIVRVESTPEAIYLPATTFTMGIDDDQRDELIRACEDAYHHQDGDMSFCVTGYRHTLLGMRARPVFVGALWFDRTEVSVAAYRRCVAAGACALDPLIVGDTRYIEPTWPVVNVTWFEARVYCAWRGGRLPTEAEWERAARDGDGRAWPWGATPRPRAWNHGAPIDPISRQLQTIEGYARIGIGDDRDGAAVLAPVGGSIWGATDRGIRDLAGNAAEWTADAYRFSDRARGYQTRTSPGPWRGDEDADEWEFLPAQNPVREGETLDLRVVRGGSWRQPEFLGRSYARDPYNATYQPTGRYTHVGFRCVRDAR